MTAMMVKKVAVDLDSSLGYTTRVIDPTDTVPQTNIKYVLQPISLTQTHLSQR